MSNPVPPFSGDSASNKYQSAHLNRRDVLKATLASTPVIASGIAVDTSFADTNPRESTNTEKEALASNDIIRRENAIPGSDDWQLTRVRVDPKSGGFRTTDIEGYCSRQSLPAGESIDIMVSTAVPCEFKIEIFRTGYYQGKGARLMTTLGPIQGTPQPTPEPGEKNLHECRWKPSVTLKIPSDWVSGVYLGRLTTTTDESGQGY